VTSFGALPLLDLSPGDERDGSVASRVARASAQRGPVIHARVPSGLLAGRCACLVGRDALEFAYGDGRGMLSSALGWRPLIGRRFGSAVLNSDEPAHRRERRAWAPAFATSALEQSIAPIEAIVARDIDRWVAARRVDAYAVARNFAFTVVATVAAGLPDDARVDELGRQFAQALAPPAGDGDVVANHAAAIPLRNAIESTLAAHVGALHPDGRQSGVPALLLRNDPSIDRAKLLEHLNILLVAGHETTATLLAWALLLLASHPHWRARLAQEAASLPRAGEVTLEALGRLRELDAFLAEVGRLHPPLVHAPRIALRDFVYAGVRIDAGTTIALGIGATHRLDAHYADPDRFRPERFLGADGSHGAAMQSPLFTFGRGARLCLGMRFASVTMKLALARLLQRASPLPVAPVECVHAGFWNARPRGTLAIAMAPLT
jgi:cytochrome P450